jgi:hypothetical protein
MGRDEAAGFSVGGLQRPVVLGDPGRGRVTRERLPAMAAGVFPSCDLADRAVVGGTGTAHSGDRFPIGLTGFAGDGVQGDEVLGLVLPDQLDETKPALA